MLIAIKFSLLMNCHFYYRYNALVEEVKERSDSSSSSDDDDDDGCSIM